MRSRIKKNGLRGSPRSPPSIAPGLWTNPSATQLLPQPWTDPAVTRAVSPSPRDWPLCLNFVGRNHVGLLEGRTLTALHFTAGGKGLARQNSTCNRLQANRFFQNRSPGTR